MKRLNLRGELFEFTANRMKDEIEDMIEEVVKKSKKRSKPLVKQERHEHKLRWFGLKMNDQLVQVIPWYSGASPDPEDFSYPQHQYENPKVVSVMVQEV